MKVTIIRKRRVLKRWVKNLLWVSLGSLIGIIIYSIFTDVNTYKTPEGNYICRGNFIQVCTSDNETFNYVK